MWLTRVLTILALCWAHVLGAAQEPFWTRSYISNKVNCVDYARDIERQALKDQRRIYFVVGFTTSNRPHAFIVVDGWALDNGALPKRVFKEDRINKYMKEFWTVDKLPKNARLRVDEYGNAEVYEGARDSSSATED